jgi:hypothetical protein
VGGGAWAQGSGTARAQGAHPPSFPQQWVLDSGASRHLTPDYDKLINVSPLASPVSVTFGNGSTGTASLEGTVRISQPDYADIVLNGVLYVPGATDNLLSIPSSTSRGIKFVFGEQQCSMFKGDIQVAVAPRTAGLYTLQPAGNNATAYASKINESAALWHYRFGHLGYSNLQRLVSKQMDTGIGLPPSAFAAAGGPGNVCKPCVIANHSRAPFKPSDSVTTTPLPCSTWTCAAPSTSPPWRAAATSPPSTTTTPSCHW